MSKKEECIVIPFVDNLDAAIIGFNELNDILHEYGCVTISDLECVLGITIAKNGHTVSQYMKECVGITCTDDLRLNIAMNNVEDCDSYAVIVMYNLGRVDN